MGAAITTSILCSRLVPQVATGVDYTPSILPQLVARIVEVLQPVQVWLFGSRARGEARVDSDWDFMAILPDGAPEQDLDLCLGMAAVARSTASARRGLHDDASEFEAWNRALGTLAEIVASTGIVIHGD